MSQEERCDPGPHWMTRTEAASFLGCCKGYVRHMVNGNRSCPSGVASVESKTFPGHGRRYRILLVSGGYHLVPVEATPLPLDEEGGKPGETKGQQFQSKETDGLLEATTKGQDIKTLEELIKVCEIDLEKWMVLEWTANSWESFYRNAQGSHTKVRLWQIKARFAPKVTSSIKGVANPQEVSLLPARRKSRSQGRLCIAIPDTQHGFRWNAKRTKLVPMHDRRAIDCVVQLIERLNPEVLVHLGDGPDFAEWSLKYPRTPDLLETTQPTIEELHWDLARFRQAAPRAERAMYLEGNHGERVRRALVEKLPVALNTIAVGDEKPALDLARLLALDQIGWTFVGAFQTDDDDWYWEDRVRFVHDGGVRGGGGKTAAAHIANADCTTIFGHIHRLELACKTVHRGKRRRVITVASPGCLCRNDGVVPAAAPRVDWQHGVALIWLTEEGEHVQLVPIVNGQMVFDGDVIVGEDRGDEIAEAIGWPVNG